MKKAFTLVEVLIVVIILGILAVIVFSPSTNQPNQQAENLTTTSQPATQQTTMPQ